MSTAVQINVNTTNFIPGSVARQREIALSSIYNYLPIGTYLNAAFGTEKQYANSVLLSKTELINSISVNGFFITGNKIYIETNDGLEYLFLCPYILQDDVVWSSVFVEGDYFLCAGSIAVWKIDGTSHEYEEVTSKLPYVPKYISSFGLRMVIGTNDTVSWSSAVDRLDYDSQGTGAGSQAINVLGAYGELQAISPAPNGFVIYTTRGILVAATTGDENIPFSFQTSILSGYVLVSPEAQSSAATHNPWAVFKGRGLCQIAIANDNTATATVQSVNPFVGQSDEFTGKIKMYPFFGGYVCIETPTVWYLVETGTNVFGALPKRYWAVLLHGTSKAINMDGEIFELSTTSNIVTSNVSSKTVYPDNIMHCDICNVIESNSTDVAGGSVRNPAGQIEQHVEMIDLQVIDPYWRELLGQDGFDTQVLPTNPAWGKEYQAMWEAMGNLIRKLDQHTEVEYRPVIDLQPDEDGEWDWDDVVYPFDVITVSFPSVQKVQSVTLIPEAMFTGVGVREQDANLQTKLTSLVVYETSGTQDTTIDCNTSEGDIDCNIMPDSDWIQTESEPVTITVNDRPFYWQKDNLFTGNTNASNHKVSIKGIKKLSELRVTLLGGGIR